MELLAYQNGELVVRVNTVQECRYSRVHGNQLILCARMNDWNRFTAMWKRKTDPTLWNAVETHISTLPVASQWKIKEAFARLATLDETNEEDPQRGNTI